MNLVESITSAYKTLVHNKVRSFLTMLGIVIGIMSVIVVMSLGDSAKGLILNEVKTLGSNLIIIMPGKTNPKGPPSTLFGNVVTTLKYKDATQILKADNPHIESVCAYVQGTDVLSWSDNNPILTFKGVMSTYIEAEGAKLQAGRFFTEEEDNYNARVIVLGSKAAKDIFGEQNPLGEKVKIRKVNFTVIGVLAERGGGLAQTQDKEVFIPLKTAQNLLLGIDYVSSIRVKVDKSENINDTIMYIEDVLRRSHNIHNPDDDDFTVRSSETAIEAIAQITSAVQFFLVAIASISLLVGGFGIMN
ncbi:MAG TPA: ABC transporter permease, partial [Candidatus Pacearchaeota archaeon]|nr:ABC transporter permease [Candidatus Pacearchaeota archaeon]